jgi:alkylation response protein AidB-like acyl-CoA dehydrogenase
LTAPPKSTRAASGEALLGAAVALGPDIQAVADRIDNERALPREVVVKLLDAGLFTMLLPATFGGAELDLPAYVRVIEALARADGSVAWCIGQANGLCNYLAYAEPAVVQELFRDGPTVLANGPGEGNRPGSAVDTGDGGYRVSGRWMFASGIGHATWLIAVCQLHDAHGVARCDADGKPMLRLMLLPKSSATIHDVWHVSGLRGTGSQSFSCSDVYVPGERAVWFAPEARRERGPLYLFTNNGLFGPAFGSVSLGLAQASLDAFLGFAAGKVPRGMDRSIRENATVQAAVAQCHARLGAARGYLHDTLRSVFSAVADSGVLHVEQQVAVRLAATHATQESVAVVDAVYTMAGSHAIFEDRPFERRFRDIHAVSQQLQARRNHYEHVGAFLLGLEPQRGFL